MAQNEKNEQVVTTLFSDQIIDPIEPMRENLDRDSLYDLADNIKQNGLINPITVRPVQWCEDDKIIWGGVSCESQGHKKGERFEVVAGHRRFTACKIAGKIKIECIIRNLTDAECFAVKAAENIERAEVDVVDESKFIMDFMRNTAKTPEEVAHTLNRGIAYVMSRLAIAEMPDYMQASLKDGTMKLGVALKLNQISDPKIKEIWSMMAARDGISVAQAEHWLHGWRLQQLPGGTHSETPPDDYKPGTPQVIKFKCALTGLEEDARQFRTLLIHESKLDLFNALAEEIQKETTEEEKGASEASD